MRVLPCGDAALLVEVDDPVGVLGLDAALREEPLPGVAEVVPAARTLLLRLEAGADPRAVAAAARRVVPRRAPAAITGAPALEVPALDMPVVDVPVVEVPVVEVPVVYDGEDLDEVGRLTGLGADGVVAAHQAAEWVVAFCGFAPGFGYLVGSDPRLHVPRRASPRTRVPTGAVALAGEYSGVYPRPSPGGWQLLGRTDLPVWDLARDPPALLQPGVRVRFRAALA